MLITDQQPLPSSTRLIYTCALKKNKTIMHKEKKDKTKCLPILTFEARCNTLLLHVICLQLKSSKGLTTGLLKIKPSAFSSYHIFVLLLRVYSGCHFYFNVLIDQVLLLGL